MPEITRRRDEVREQIFQGAPVDEEGEELMHKTAKWQIAEALDKLEELRNHAIEVIKGG